MILYMISIFKFVEIISLKSNFKFFLRSFLGLFLETVEQEDGSCGRYDIKDSDIVISKNSNFPK